MVIEVLSLVSVANFAPGNSEMSPSVRLKNAVSTLRNLLLCSVCSELLSDTHTVTECGHLFCSVCAYHHVGTRMTCPTCGLPARVGKLVKNPKYDVLVACVKRLMRNMLAPENAEDANAPDVRKFPVVSPCEDPPPASSVVSRRTRVTRSKAGTDSVKCASNTTREPLGTLYHEPSLPNVSDYLLSIDNTPEQTRGQGLRPASPTPALNALLSWSAPPKVLNQQSGIEGEKDATTVHTATPVRKRNRRSIAQSAVSSNAPVELNETHLECSPSKRRRAVSSRRSSQLVEHDMPAPNQVSPTVEKIDELTRSSKVPVKQKQSKRKSDRVEHDMPAPNQVCPTSGKIDELAQSSKVPVKQKKCKRKSEHVEDVMPAPNQVSPTAGKIDELTPSSKVPVKQKQSKRKFGHVEHDMLAPNQVSPIAEKMNELTRSSKVPVKQKQSKRKSEHVEHDMPGPNQISPTSAKIDELTPSSKISVKQKQSNRKSVAKANDSETSKARRKSEGPNFRPGVKNECEKDAVSEARRTRRSTFSTMPCDVSKTQKQGFGGNEPERFVEVLLTGVSGEQMRLIESAAATGASFESSKSSLLFSISPTKTFDEHITHVVAGTVLNSDGSYICGRTLKYMYGVAKGIWVVRSEWLLDSLAAGKWMQEEDYEIQGDAISGRSEGPKKARERRQGKLPPLFDQCRFHFHGEFGWPNVSLQDLGHLVLLGGGTVLHRRPTAKIYATGGKPCATSGGSPPANSTDGHSPHSVEQESLTPNPPSSNHSQIESDRLDLSLPLVVIDPGRTDANDAAWMCKYQMVSSIWLLDCISAGRVLLEKRGL